MPSVWIWAWRQMYGFLLVGGPGGGGVLPLQGKVFRVMARFEGDRVQSLETQIEPERVKSIGDALPGPTASLPWVGPVHPGREDTLFAVGKAGDLWRKEREDRDPVLLIPGGGKNGQGSSIAVSDDNRLISVAGTSKMFVWDARAGVTLVQSERKKGPWRYPPWGAEARFSPQGRWLAIVGSRDSVLLDMTTRQVVWSDAERSWSSAAFSPSGNRLVVIGFRELRVIDTATGSIVGRMELPVAFPWSANLPSDDELLLASNSVITRWSLAEIERLSRERQPGVRLLKGLGEEALREVRLLPILPVRKNAPDRTPLGAPLISDDGTLVLLQGPGAATPQASSWFRVYQSTDLREVGTFHLDDRALGIRPLRLGGDGTLFGIQTEIAPSRFGNDVPVYHVWRLPLSRKAVPSQGTPGP